MFDRKIYHWGFFKWFLIEANISLKPRWRTPMKGPAAVNTGGVNKVGTLLALIVVQGVVYKCVGQDRATRRGEGPLLIGGGRHFIAMAGVTSPSNWNKCLPIG